MMCRIKKTIALALAAAVGIVFAQSAPRWQNLYPTYSGLAFDDSKFIAVSGDGLIRTTTDGETWFNSFINDNDEGNSRRIYAIACGGGRYVALQNSSKYLHSGDGNGWASDPTALPSNVAWKYIVYGVGAYGWEFVAVDAAGGTGRFDEDDWDRVSSGASSLSHAAFGAGTFVVAGDGIKSSRDAFGWGSTTGASGQIAVVAFDGSSKFAALSKTGTTAYTSEDGQSWTSGSASCAADMADMVFGGGKFVAVGKAGNSCFSSNGTSWTSSTGLNPDDDFTAVKYGTSFFLALGAKGSVYKSTNGESWTQLYGNSVASYKQIVFGNNKYVAVGDSGVSVSSDGIKWERKTGAKNLTGVAFGANKFVAVNSDGVIYTSGDGTTWTDYNAGDAVFTSVAFGGTTFIAGGRTSGAAAQSKVVVYTSTDGATWTGYDATDLAGWATQGEHIVSLCSGGGKFIAAVGGATKALKECDVTGSNVGKFWSGVQGLPDAADGYPMISAVYANDKFVALGTKSTGEAILINSDNASSWTPITIPNITTRLRAATYAKGSYFAVGDSGSIYAYMNGSWIRQGKGTTNRNLSTVYSDANAVIAAGTGGAILRSTAEPTSVKYASTPKVASSKGGVMRLSRFGRASSVTLSFTPNGPGAISVYSLSGRLLYKARLGAGERSASLPERVMSNGSVIVRYSGSGRVVNQRFQIVR